MRDLIINTFKILCVSCCTVVVAAGCGALLDVLFSQNELAGYIGLPAVAVCLSFVIYRLVE